MKKNKKMSLQEALEILMGIISLLGLAVLCIVMIAGAIAMVTPFTIYSLLYLVVVLPLAFTGVAFFAYLVKGIKDGRIEII